MRYGQLCSSAAREPPSQSSPSGEEAQPPPLNSEQLPPFFPFGRPLAGSKPTPPQVPRLRSGRHGGLARRYFGHDGFGGVSCYCRGVPRGPGTGYRRYDGVAWAAICRCVAGGCSLRAWGFCDVEDLVGVDVGQGLDCAAGPANLDLVDHLRFAQSEVEGEAVHGEEGAAGR